MPLAVAVSLAWLSGVCYLVARLGTSWLPHLATVDAVHIYAGVAVFTLLGSTIGVRRRRGSVPGLEVPGRDAAVTLTRCVRTAIGALYVGVTLTGVGVLLPVAGHARAFLVDAHLVSAGCAAGLTVVYIAAKYGRLARRYMSAGVRHLPARRSALAAVVLLVPAFALAPTGRPASPLARSGGGSQWQPIGPAVFVDRMARDPRDQRVVAAGEGLLVSASASERRPSSWYRVGPFGARNVVLGLSLPMRGPTAVYVGAVTGLWAASSLSGPYRRLAFPSTTVHSIAVDPRDPSTVWATSLGGIFRSRDEGASWSGESRGLAAPTSAWALRFADGGLYSSDESAVYRWTGSTWARSSSQWGVVSLDPAAGDLFASSMGDGVRVLRDGRWFGGSDGLPRHDEDGLRGVHAVSVTAAGARAWIGTMVDGGGASIDGGRSWIRSFPSLSSEGVTWRLLQVGDQLVAATDRGIFATPLPSPARPRVVWWVGVVCVGVLAALWAKRCIEDVRP